MDPITVIGLLASVVQLIDVTSKVVNYFNHMKDAPKDRAKLVREATGLLALFADLRYRVEETTSTNPWFASLQSLGGQGGPLMEFKSAMEDIADKLAPATSSMNLGRILRWTFDKKEINAILSRIERLKSLVSLALHTDHFTLSLAMKEEITVGFEEMKTDRNFIKINQWLAAPLPSLNHNTAMKRRQSRTGEWFTQSKEFAEWKIGVCSFLWLHGIPGCGKTVLCSTIIQDVISNYQFDPSVAVAYFYFDFSDLDKRRVETLIRSLIVQLSSQYPHLPESLQSAYSRSQNGQNQPTVEELATLLRQMVNDFNSTYILLDALDECADRKNLFEFIEAVMNWDINNLHVLATSRRENDIATSLESLVTCQMCIQNSLVDADIRVYILERLSNDTRLKNLPVSVQKEIEDTLMNGAKGMFRWVVCQLDSLQKCLRLDAVRNALSTLPKSLDDTYERILSNLDEEYEEDALKILQWLCFSVRPMRLDEMVEVLAIDSSLEPRFRPEARLLDPCDILTICSTLISVTAAAGSTQTVETQQLRLAHYSVKEYLISDRLKKTSIHRYHITPPSASISITKTCLAYLLHFEGPNILTAGFRHDYPFIEYAAKFWSWHYRKITDDTGRDAADFLGYKLVESKNSRFINWLRIFNPDRLLSESDLNLEANRISSPLYYMSSLGVSGVVQLLLDKDAEVNSEGGLYGHPLSAASFAGHEKVVQMLLEKGANVYAEGGPFGNALSAASFNGNEKVVRLLLENGASVNDKGGTYGNALSAASRNNSEEVVRLLLEKEADVNAGEGTFSHALSAASGRGHEKVIRLLLDKGANINAKSGPYGNALSAASYEGHEEVVRVLLDKGANVNARGGIYGHPLVAASSKGCQQIVRLLLEKGANVNAEGRRSFDNALSAASSGGHEEVVRLLLEKGADVNARSGCALREASKYGQKAIMRLLLESKADFNLVIQNNCKELAEISVDDHEAVIQLLLKRLELP